VSNRLLIETGFSTNMEYVTIWYQPGLAQERFSPAWYTTNIGKLDLITTAAWNGVVAPTYGLLPAKYVASASASYVTGSHSLKAGMQWGFGKYRIDRDINADLVQYYFSGVPGLVAVQNTPVNSHETQNADLGLYVQDSWTRNRLTLNMGVRFEYFNTAIAEQHVGAGRFVPERHFDKVSDIPNWFDIAPRFGVAYDLFGNAKTALKGTINKYMAGQGVGFAQRYNPLQAQSDLRTWTDPNGDDIAQDNEIGPPANASFGLPVLVRRPGEDLGREYDMEYTAGIQHELVPGLSVNATYYRRSTYAMTRTTPTQFTPSDYTIVNIANPLDGSPIPIYNIDVAKRGLIDRVDNNVTDADDRSLTYNGFEIGAAGRFGRAAFFGGWTFDRRVLLHCDEIENWGNLQGSPSPAAPSTLYPAGLVNMNQPKADYHYCDQSNLDIPFQHEFKVSGSYSLPWDVQINAAFQSYPGQQLPTRWSLTNATRYPLDCKGACDPGGLVIPNLSLASYNVDLTPPGTDYYERHNQLDIGFRKLFRINRYTISGQLDLFNSLNSSYVKTQNTTFGSSLGTPLSILQPRLMRLAMQLRF
jgi:hypothetical protein